VRVARLRKRESHRKQTGGAGAEQHGLCRGSRGVLRPCEPSRRAGVRVGDGDPHPGYEYERRDIGCSERGDRPRRSLGKRDARDDDSAEHAEDHSLGSQPRVVRRDSLWI
jgi:hypothetical protein